MKTFYEKYKPFFKAILTALGMIAIYDWVIAPGLTVDNTFYNILAFLGGSIMILIFGLLVWENLFKTDKKEEKWQDNSTMATGQTSKEDNESSTNKDNESLNN